VNDRDMQKSFFFFFPVPPMLFIQPSEIKHIFFFLYVFYILLQTKQ